MQSSRDSSVWRTLAVAFGDGLAFGAGVSLTRGAARLATPKPAPAELRPLTERITEIEQRIERARVAGTLPVAGTPLNHKAADAVLTVIDGRFTEFGGHMDRRLAELEVRIKMDLDALDAQDRTLAGGVESRIDGLRGEITEALTAQRKGIDADLRTLRAQMSAIHKEFAETLARLVDEQIAKVVAARVQAVEDRVRETLLEEIRRSGHGEQIAELRERVDSQEGNVLSLVMALGRSCLQAAERMSPSEAPAEPPAGGPSAAATDPGGSGGGGGANEPAGIRAEQAADADLPGFARTEPRKPLWHLPIVSSFLAVTGGLLLLHYL